MDLSYSSEHLAFQDEVHAFLDMHWSPRKGLRGQEKRQAEFEFRQLAIDEGYLYRGIPRQYGGSEQTADVIKAQIIRDAFSLARAPMEAPGVGVGMLVPTLLECGTEWQKDNFVRPTLTGEIFWAQGYSEPNAGSDLAAIRTKGELINDEWVINGQKVWSSLAQHAQYMFVLVRTEPSAPKHQNLSYLLIDLNQPGITVRPLKQITGGEEFCEVFFDDARTPAHMLVGERGKGWKVSRTTLSHERSGFIGNAANSVNLFEKLVSLAKEAVIDGKSAISNPDIRQRLATLEAHVISHQYSSYRQLSMTVHNQEPGIIGLMGRLLATNIVHEVAKLARGLIVDDLLISERLGGSRGPEKWNNHFFGSLGIAIAGGTSNIQRNIIAEGGLGLPRDVFGKE